MVKVKFSEMDDAYFFSGDSMDENEAYLCSESGKFYFKSDWVDKDNPLPDDLEENIKYILLPNSDELITAHPKDFVREVMAEHIEKLNDIFSRKGAYRRFKDWLIQIDRIDDWYDYESKATAKALREWCEENDVNLID